MNKYLSHLKTYLETKLTENLAICSKRESFVVSQKEARLELSDAINPPVIILLPDTYISLTKTYKVIAKKELVKIIENEKSFISPFAPSLVLYRIDDIGDGQWLVHFYFIDKSLVHNIERAKLITVWDEVVRLATSEQTESAIIRSPLGNYVLEIAAGKRMLSVIGEQQSLRHRVLMQQCNNDVPIEVTTESIFRYFVSFDWIGLKGAINKKAFKSERELPKPTLKQVSYFSLAIVTVALLESIYLTSLSGYIDNVAENTAAQRNEYSAKKAKFLDDLTRYEGYLAITENRTHVSSLSILFDKLPNKSSIEISRMDYLQGEVRISGFSDDINALMTFLENQNEVRNLDYISPITPGDNGRDRFAIKFEYYDS